MAQDITTVLVVGWFLPDRAAFGFANALEHAGCTVLRASTDEFPYSRYNIKADWYLMDLSHHQRAEIMAGRERLNVADIFHNLVLKYGDNIDCIILVQNTLVTYDVASSYSKPIYYLFNEMWWVQWPLYNTTSQITGIFYSFYRGKEMLEKSFQSELFHCQFAEFLPYAVDVSVFYDADTRFEDRPIFCGFKGSLQYGSGLNIYKTRTRLLAYGRDHCGIDISPRSDDPHYLEKYRKYLQTCQIGINIPGDPRDYPDAGMINDRQFQIIACGCVLLQYDYPALKDQGFEDRENCLLFTDEKELKCQLVWAKEHPEELHAIRAKGMELVFFNHTYKQRAKIILDKMVRKD
jgi:Glycosyl transferases group 1